MQLPREVIVGRGSVEFVGSICRSLGFTKSALIITGEVTFEVAGKAIKEQLEGEGLRVEKHVITSNMPSINDVKACEEKIRRFKPQVVLGVGGGAKIDIAKLSSANQGVPFISIPTTASHDGISSPFASIKGLGKPYSLMAQSPIAIIADTDIIGRAPYRFIASGCGDVIAKLTAVKDWKLAHERKNEYYAQYTASMSLMSAHHLVENSHLIRPNSEEGLRVLLESLISCGIAMAIAGSSRPCSGSEHLFSHALDLIAPKPALHGEQCGVGTIMMAYLHGLDWKRIVDYLRRVGAPTTAEEIGIEPKYIVEALVIAPRIRPERYTILHERPLSHEEALALAKETGVIG
ncbi:MAG: NAD(P)-dependent glycerol-1-phosphate dehydrogenase [Candidatus Bathyarchaeia archaeon]|nr:NAD(P)-dependent glycerol-1-phosphate dehydrogenase [Candidatus Bathyarchaeota archaeon]